MIREFSIQQMDKVEYFGDFCNSEEGCCNWVSSRGVHCMLFKQDIHRVENWNLKRCSACIEFFSNEGNLVFYEKN